MQCEKCGNDMVSAPYILASNPPQYRYDCKCGHVEFVAQHSSGSFEREVGRIIKLKRE